MRIEKLTIQVTTLSNLFIGGSPAAFEIGGIDLFTVTNFQGRPYIPASSIKGTLRSIIKERKDLIGSQVIGEAYQKYLSALRAENIKRLQDMNIDEERKISVEKRFEELGQATSEFLFGMEGFNRSPKLLFNDLKVIDVREHVEDYFSIDSKNSIEQISNPEEKLAAIPRIYKTVRPGVIFQGDILFYQLDQLNIEHAQVRDYVVRALEQLNTGIYRLGNSGSRGYGRVRVEIIQERE